MASSLRVGVSCLLNRNIKQADMVPHAALICLADMPLIKPQTIDTLINSMDESLRRNAIDTNREPFFAFVPCYENTRGNPVLLLPDLFDLLLDIAGDVGARHLLQNNPDAVREVAVNDSGILFDCDTPEQLER
jgi:molybdenum cofactor cytidylyltransferase